MASPIVKGQAFGTTETVTAAKLQNIVDSASFKDFDGSTEVFNVSGSTDIGTCVLAGGLAVKTSTGQLQIKDNGVTLAKMATQADQTVLGNVSGGTAVPTAVPIVGAAGILVNSDSLGTDDTKGATQGNVKAYVDNLIGTADKSGSGLVTEGTQGSLILGAGLIIKFGTVDVNASTVAFTFKDSSGNASPFPNAIYGVSATVNESIGSASETCSVTLPTVNGCSITGYQGVSGAAVGRVFFVAYGF